MSWVGGAFFTYTRAVMWLVLFIKWRIDTAKIKKIVLMVNLIELQVKLHNKTWLGVDISEEWGEGEEGRRKDDGDERREGEGEGKGEKKGVREGGRDTMSQNNTDCGYLHVQCHVYTCIWWNKEWWSSTEIPVPLVSWISLPWCPEVCSVILFPDATLVSSHHEQHGSKIDCTMQKAAITQN